MSNKASERIEYHKTFETGPARLFMILSGLKFEIETGMRLTSRAPKCSTILRKEFGLSGNPEKLFYTFQALLAKHGFVKDAPQA